jgi:hypothetical protein
MSITTPKHQLEKSRHAKWRHGLIEPTDEMGKIVGWHSQSVHRRQLATTQISVGPLFHVGSNGRRSSNKFFGPCLASVATSLPHHHTMTGMDGCNRQTQQAQPDTHLTSTRPRFPTLPATNTAPVRVDWIVHPFNSAGTVLYYQELSGTLPVSALQLGLLSRRSHCNVQYWTAQPYQTILPITNRTPPLLYGYSNRAVVLPVPPCTKSK